MLREFGLVGGIREVEMRGFLLDAEVFIVNVFRHWGRTYAWWAYALSCRHGFGNDTFSSSEVIALVQTSIHQALATYKAQSELAPAISTGVPLGEKQGEEERTLV